ncbi:MAG: hypothetical protein D6744_00405 [Planctomycetota bacterium]|nr:MAG: hypothetical protein D6744_00405 [Planctomycetota bacterium]
MNLLRWLFLESTPALAIVLAVALFVLLVYWRRTLRARPLLIGLAAAAALLTLQAVIVTPREHALALMRVVERDVVDGRTDGLAAALGRGFEAGERDREAFLDFVHRQQQRVHVHSVRRGSARVEKQAGDSLTLLMQYGARVTSAGYSGSIPSVWRITFERQGKAWRITRIEPVRLGLMNLASWREFEMAIR